MQSSRVLPLGDAMKSSGRVFKLVPTPLLQDFGPPGESHRDGLAMFHVTDTLHRGKVQFTIGSEPAIYEGEPEDFGWLIVGLLSADNERDRDLADAIMTFITEQIADSVRMAQRRYSVHPAFLIDSRRTSARIDLLAHMPNARLELASRAS